VGHHGDTGGGPVVQGGDPLPLDAIFRRTRATASALARPPAIAAAGEAPVALTPTTRASSPPE